MSPYVRDEWRLNVGAPGGQIMRCVVLSPNIYRIPPRSRAVFARMPLAGFWSADWAAVWRMSRNWVQPL